MKKIAVIHLNEGSSRETVRILGHDVEIERVGCGGDSDKAAMLIREYDGQVDAIGLEGMPAELRLGMNSRPHDIGSLLPTMAQKTAVVDGCGLRAGLERWAVILAEREHPGIFNQKRILMVPGLNHRGLTAALSRRTPSLRYADPGVYFGLPFVAGVGRKVTVEKAAVRTLEQLHDAPFRRICPQPGLPSTPRYTEPFEWADILAGDIGAILRYAPHSLAHKTIVVDHATPADVAELQQRGAATLLTLMPALIEGEISRWSVATMEALFVAVRPDPDMPLIEDTYLDLLSQMEWTPTVLPLQVEESDLNRFAFVIHPLTVKFVQNHPNFRWTRFFPDPLIELIAAQIRPMYLSRMRGIVSPTTGQKVEGYLITLGLTPRQMLSRKPEFTYGRLIQAARMAERRGARIMGLGAFTSVVGDAGVTVANNSNIAITTGNSLTVAVTLESAKQALQMMGMDDLTRGRVMVIGATGSIGSVCSRLLAQAIFDVVLVGREPEKLIELKRTIQAETPEARVVISTRPNDYLGDCDLLVTATSAFGQRIVDISKCKPGMVICDVARPTDISEAEAALRPDVLVIESGEVIIPGDVEYGFDIGLPDKTAYACLAETALLAMEGRFEDYTIGRAITMERVKEIYHLFLKHWFRLADLRSFGAYVTAEMVAEKMALAQSYRDDPALFADVQKQAKAELHNLPVVAKGVTAADKKKGMAGLLGLTAVFALLLLVFGKRKGN